jgi:2-amino-4,5-dihydroxy-6-oxo-7-(phosphooxy)heptanoate synthase
MSVNDGLARRMRLQRLHRHDDGRLLVVPLDHPVSNGPIVRDGQLDRLIGQIHFGGADAVVLHKGALRTVQPRWFRDMSLIVHLSAGTALAPDPDARHLVCTVEEALRLGAHGVSVHVNVGSRGEGRQIADLAAVAESCDRWGVPLLAMVYARGPGVDGRAPAVVAHVAALAAELGADLVKTVLPDAPQAIAAITAACPIPVLAAGGALADGPDEALLRLDDAMQCGARGVAAGRLVFTAADPAAMVRRLTSLVHDRAQAPLQRAGDPR